MSIDKASLFSSCAFLLVVMLTCHAAFAADAHRLELKEVPDLVGTSELVAASDVAISPDGNWVAYTVTTTVIITQKTQQRLFVQPFAGGETTQIGPQEADSSSPEWSPDSSKLLFFSTSAGHRTAAIWEVKKKDVHVLDIAVHPWATPEWLPDSARLLVALAPHEGAATPLADPKTLAPMVFTASDTNRRLDGGHYLGMFSLHNSSESFDFAIVEVGSGKARTVAANIDPNISNYQISPDGTKLAYVVNKGEFDYDANNRILHDIKVDDLQNGSTVVAASSVLGWGGLPISWSRDSKMLAVVGGTVQDDSASPTLGGPMFDRPGHCYVIDLKKPGVLRPVGPRSLWRLAKPTWSEDDSSIYAVSSKQNDSLRKIIQLNLATGASQTAATMPAMSDIDLSDVQNAEGDDVHMAILDPAGETSHEFGFNLRSHKFTEISGGNYTINSLSVSRAGTHAAYLAVDSSHPNNVWVNDERGEAHRLTHFDLTKEQQEKIGETKSVTWEYNGRTLHGTLWLPANYREGQRRPTILDVYPGGQGSSMRNFFRSDPFADDLIWPAFSARGYAVFWPDFFLRVGDGPHEIAAQIIPALDKLVAMGVADPNGFGVHGRSHGGYSTYALITETQRFGAAIPSVGYSNEFTAYGELDDNSSPYVLGLFENDDLGVSPWQNRDLYIKTSPYFNFEKVTTPVLIQYGEKDRPFAWTSKEAFVALRRLGKTATLLGYPDEGHGVNKPENQVDFTNRALDFFDQYLKPGEQASSAAATHVDPPKQQYKRWRELKKMQAENDSKPGHVGLTPAAVN